jgi:predicted secreted protein
MAAVSGRKLRIKKGGTAVAGARTDNLTINNEPIDITDKAALGWRTLLADAGVRSIDADVEGVITDATFLALAVGTASSLLAAYTLEIDGVGTFAGNFYLNSFAVSGEQADTVTFTANIQSSGTITWTAA